MVGRQAGEALPCGWLAGAAELATCTPSHLQEPLSQWQALTSSRSSPIRPLRTWGISLRTPPECPPVRSAKQETDEHGHSSRTVVEAVCLRGPEDAPLQ
jgi:hypothetical protein